MSECETGLDDLGCVTVTGGRDILQSGMSNTTALFQNLVSCALHRKLHPN